MINPQLVFQQIRQLKLTQDDLKKAKFEVKNGSFKAVVSGDLKVLELAFPGAKPAVVANLKKVLNQAISKSQKNVMDSLAKLTK